jgi:hypothetical protein
MEDADDGRDPRDFCLAVETTDLDLETVHIIEKHYSFNAVPGKSAVVESGSSKNIASDLSLFVTTEQCRIRITGVGPTPAISTLKGEARFSAMDKDGNPITIALKDTLYVPDLAHTVLLSISTLANEGGIFTAQKYGSKLSLEEDSVPSAGGTTDFPVVRNGGIYRLALTLEEYNCWIAEQGEVRVELTKSHAPITSNLASHKETIPHGPAHGLLHARIGHANVKAGTTARALHAGRTGLRAQEPVLMPGCENSPEYQDTLETMASCGTMDDCHSCQQA